MNNIEPTTDSTTATFTAIIVRPRCDLTPEERADMAENLLDSCWRYTRATKKAIQHESFGLDDLCSGRAPRTIWARCYAQLNEFRLPGAPMREPTQEHVDQFKAWWGVVFEATLVMLIELPTAGEAFDKMLQELRKLPCRAVEHCDVAIGTHKDRAWRKPFSNIPTEGT